MADLRELRGSGGLQTADRQLPPGSRWGASVATAGLSAQSAVSLHKRHQRSGQAAPRTSIGARCLTASLECNELAKRHRLLSEAAAKSWSSAAGRARGAAELPTHLVVAAYEVHVGGVLDLERQQQADGLQRVGASIHIVPLPHRRLAY